MHWRIERFKHTLLNTLSTQANTARDYLWSIREKRLPKTPDRKVLFHIDCGEINSPEFINIDARKDKHIHIITRNIFSTMDDPFKYCRSDIHVPYIGTCS